MGKKLTGGSSEGSINFLNPDKNLLEGDVYEGYYVETRERTGKYGVQKTHYFRTVDGEMFGISGSGGINSALAKSNPVNRLLRIEYQGRQEMKKGPNAGTRAITFDIEDITDDGDTKASPVVAPAPRPLTAAEKVAQVAQQAKKAKG